MVDLKDLAVALRDLSADKPGSGFGVAVAAVGFLPFGDLIKGVKRVDGAVSGLAKGGEKANVAIDANVAIRAIEGGESMAVDAVLAGRNPIIPIQAVKEFLVKGDVDALRGFLEARGGRVAAGASDQAAGALQAQAKGLGRSLKPKDARVAASAQKEGVSLITRDTKLRKFLNAVGIGGESF